MSVENIIMKAPIQGPWPGLKAVSRQASTYGSLIGASAQGKQELATPDVDGLGRKLYISCISFPSLACFSKEISS